MTGHEVVEQVAKEKRIDAWLWFAAAALIAALTSGLVYTNNEQRAAAEQDKVAVTEIQNCVDAMQNGAPEGDHLADIEKYLQVLRETP